LDSVPAAGWLILQAGTLAVATLVVALRGESKRIVAGIALEKYEGTEQDCGLGALTSCETSL